MPLNELVYHGKVVRVGFVGHDPASRDNLQLPSEDQPVERRGLGKRGEDNPDSKEESH